MAATTVFVDDAVRGDLPAVCAKTGVPASKRLTIHEDMTGGLGALWLAVFFGPLGWVVLALVALSRRRTTLTVRIPYSDPELADYVRTARRTVHLAIATGVALVLVAAAHFGQVLTDAPTAMLTGIAVLVVGGTIVLVNGVLARRRLVGIGLDASGRWVNLTRVHPAFAAACDAQRASATQPGRQPV